MVTRTEIRELDLRARLTGIDEAIDTLNRLVAAEEGVVVTSEKMVRSDASVARSVNALQGRYVEHHKLIQQTTRDMNLLHEAKSRGLVQDEEYQRTLAGMQAKLLAVSAASTKAAGDSATRSRSLRDEAAAWRNLGTEGAAALARIEASARIGSMSRGAGPVGVQRSPEIERLRRTQEAETTQRLLNESFGIGRAVPSARASASVFEEAAQDAEEAARRVKAAADYAAGGWDRLGRMGSAEYARLAPATVALEANRAASARLGAMGGPARYLERPPPAHVVSGPIRR